MRVREHSSSRTAPATECARVLKVSHGTHVLALSHQVRRRGHAEPMCERVLRECDTPACVQECESAVCRAHLVRVDERADCAKDERAEKMRKSRKLVFGTGRYKKRGRVPTLPHLRETTLVHRSERTLARLARTRIPTPVADARNVSRLCVSVSELHLLTCK